MLKRIIPYAHHLLETSVKEGDVVVDATCGNGNDTLLLSSLVGETGTVYAVDVQEQAIETTKKLLTENERSNVEFIHDSHANLEQYLPESLKGTLGGAIFNLGYLPRSDKQIITQGESTIAAVETLLEFIRKKALVILVVYHGHEGGAEEKDAVLSYVKQLDQKKYAVLQYKFLNQQNNPPFVIAIEKISSFFSMSKYAKMNVEYVEPEEENDTPL